MGAGNRSVKLLLAYTTITSDLIQQRYNVKLTNPRLLIYFFFQPQNYVKQLENLLPVRIYRNMYKKIELASTCTYKRASKHVEGQVRYCIILYTCLINDAKLVFLACVYIYARL